MNIQDAIRRVASELEVQLMEDRDSSKPLSGQGIVNVLENIANAAGELDAETPRPASPDVRECLEAMITFAENSRTLFRTNTMGDLITRLATEARAALAKPVEPPDYDDLVAGLEKVRQSLRAMNVDGHITHAGADSLMANLGHLIAKAKGQTNG